MVLSWLGLLWSGRRYGFLWCSLGSSFLKFLCGSCYGSRLFCFNCGFVSAMVLCGVVWARVFFSCLPYCIALGFIIVAGCGFVLAESSCCGVVCHPGFSIVRSLAGLGCLGCSFLFISVVAVV